MLFYSLVPTTTIKNRYREFEIGRIRRESLGVLGGKAAQNTQNPSYPELKLDRFWPEDALPARRKHV